MTLFSKKKEEVDASKNAKNVKKAKSVATTKKQPKKVTTSSVFAHILLAPVVTEKAYTLSEANKYVFRVSPCATKAQVRKAVADIYGVTVVGVNLMIKKQQTKVFRGIKGKTRTQKKAIVTIDAGQKIDLFE